MKSLGQIRAESDQQRWEYALRMHEMHTRSLNSSFPSLVERAKERIQKLESEYPQLKEKKDV
jgi:hypothetical protein